MQSFALAWRVLKTEGPGTLWMRAWRRIRVVAEIARYRWNARLGHHAAKSPVEIIAASLERDTAAALEGIWQLAQQGDVRAVVPDHVRDHFARIRHCGAHRIEVFSYGELSQYPGTPFDTIALHNGLLCKLPIDVVRRVVERWTLTMDAKHVGVFSAPKRRHRGVEDDRPTRGYFRGKVRALERLRQNDLLHETPFGAPMRCHYSDMDLGIIDDVWHEYLGWGLNIGPRDVIVDIGANIGAFSVACATQSTTNRIFAFEPCPDNFRLLQENIARNCPGRVQARQCAVHRNSGTRTLYLSAEQSGGHSLYGSGEEMPVRCVSLAEIVNEIGQTIDILKIDAEGSEYAILFGAEELLRTRVRTIVMETHRCGRWSGQDMVQYLRGLGFNVQTKGNDPGMFLLLAQRVAANTANPVLGPVLPGATLGHVAGAAAAT